MDMDPSLWDQVQVPDLGAGPERFVNRSHGGHVTVQPVHPLLKEATVSRDKVEALVHRDRDVVPRHVLVRQSGVHGQGPLSQQQLEPGIRVDPVVALQVEDHVFEWMDGDRLSRFHDVGTGGDLVAGSDGDGDHLSQVDGDDLLLDDGRSPDTGRDLRVLALVLIRSRFHDQEETAFRQHDPCRSRDPRNKGPQLDGSDCIHALGTEEAVQDFGDQGNGQTLDPSPSFLLTFCRQQVLTTLFLLTVDSDLKVPHLLSSDLLLVRSGATTADGGDGALQSGR